MMSMRRNPARYWMMNVMITLGLAVIHFTLYVTLRGMTFAPGDSGHTLPAMLEIVVGALGLPVMPFGDYLSAHLPQWISSSFLGHNAVGFFHVLAGINALLFGAWTVAQGRVLPGLIRIIHRSVTSRIASHRV